MNEDKNSINKDDFQNSHLKLNEKLDKISKNIKGRHYNIILLTAFMSFLFNCLFLPVSLWFKSSEEKMRATYKIQTEQFEKVSNIYDETLNKCKNLVNEIKVFAKIANKLTQSNLADAWSDLNPIGEPGFSNYYSDKFSANLDTFIVSASNLIAENPKYKNPITKDDIHKMDSLLNILINQGKEDLKTSEFFKN